MRCHHLANRNANGITPFKPADRPARAADGVDDLDCGLWRKQRRHRIGIAPIMRAGVLAKYVQNDCLICHRHDVILQEILRGDC